MKEVTEGNRITLTFNLYWNSLYSDPRGNSSEDLNSLSWVAELKELFKCKDYLGKRK